MLTNLIKVQEELKAPKNLNNTFGGYKYRNCESILEAVKPLLSKYGLLLSLTDDISLVGDRFYVKATATITDGKESLSVSALARESIAKKGMDDSQITGTASSYARKYALNGLFLIDDTKDADSDEYRKESQKRAEATAKAQESDDLQQEVTLAEKEAFIKTCQSMNLDPMEILTKVGLEKGEKMKKLHQGRALKMLQNIQDERNKNEKRNGNK